MGEQFCVFTSMRYDPALPGEADKGLVHSYPDTPITPFYLLHYHRDRLLQAARCFHWAGAVEFLEQPLARFLEFLDASVPDKTSPWRLRVVVDSSGKGTVEASPLEPTPIVNLLGPIASGVSSDILSVYVDSETTTPSMLTAHKTTARDHYTKARRRCGILSTQTLAEVLLVNPKGEVMEGSVTTVYFRWRRSVIDEGGSPGPEWTTPPLCSGCNAGTTRRYALTQGFCSERRTNTADLTDGEECWLSNAVFGFRRGRIVLNR